MIKHTLKVCGFVGVGWFLIAILPNLDPHFAHEQIGPFYPRIIDADTIARGSDIIRISGVDACEIGQPVTFGELLAPFDCGVLAKEALTAFIAGRNVICFDQGSRSYGRIIGRCFVEAENQSISMKTDIGAHILSSGWAVPEQGEITFRTRYALEYYIALLNGRGGLNGNFQRPADWRRNK